MSLRRDFTDYIHDLITSGLAEKESSADFLIAGTNEGELVYIEPEAAAVWLITVQEARFVPADAEQENA